MSLHVQVIVKEVTPREGDRYPETTTLAEFDLESRPEAAFEVFQNALAGVLTGDVELRLGPLSDEEAERIRERFKAPIK